MATSGGYPNEADEYETESDDAPLDLGDGPDAAEKAHFLEVCFLVFGDPSGDFFGWGWGGGKMRKRWHLTDSRVGGICL